MTPKKHEDTKQQKQEQPKATATPQPQTAPPQAQTAKPVEPTKPEPAPSKQQQTISKLKQAWTEKGVDLSKLSERQDGKFILLQPTPDWPLIRVGPTGGLELPQVRSFAKAWDACVDGLNVYQKQLARDQKKAANAQATKAPQPAPAKQPAVKAETPTARKAKESEQLEKQLAHA